MDTRKEINISVLRQLVEGGGRKTFFSAMDDVKMDLMNQLLSTPLDKKEERENLYFICKAIDKLEAQFVAYINDDDRLKEND